MFKRRIALLFGLTVIAGGLFLIVRGPAGSEDGSRDQVNVRLKWLHQAQFAGFYAAEGMGFYEEVGLDVQLNPGGVDFQAIQMVAAGGEQFGVTGADQLLMAREREIPVVALAVIYRKSPMVLFALRESGISVPADLEGRTVGVKRNEEITYRALVKRAGVDSALISEVPVNHDLTPFFSRAVDVWPGYVINETLEVEEQGHEINVIWPSDYGVDLYADVLFTTEAMIEERPDVVRGFVEATIRGWEYALQFQQETVGFTVGYSEHLNREHEAAMLLASIDFVKPDTMPIGVMEEGAWEHMQDLLLEIGVMEHAVILGSLYTNRFLR